MTAELDKPLTLEEEQSPSALILRIRGSVSISDAETLQAKMEDIAGRQIPLVVIDLCEMQFICSTGLGAIIVGHLKSRHHKGKIHLVDPQPNVRQILETTRLTKLFPIYDSIEEAIGSE